MLRLLLYLLALLTCVVAGVWERSHYFADGVEINNRHGSILLTTQPGRVRIAWPSPTFPNWEQPRPHLCASSVPNSGEPLATAPIAPGDWKHWFFDYQNLTFNQPPFQSIDARLWPVVTLLGMFPVLALTRRLWRKVSRHLRGHCVACGYDLRATRDQCPECGRVVRQIQYARMARRWLFRVAMVAGIFVAVCWFGRHDFRDRDEIQLDFKMISDFNFDDEHGTIADIPASMWKFNGRRVALDGFMIPMDTAEDIQFFALVPFLPHDLAPPPRLAQTIVARIIPAKRSQYYPDRIRIHGTFHIAAAHDTGYLVGIYWMDVDRITPANEGPR